MYLNFKVISLIFIEVLRFGPKVGAKMQYLNNCKANCFKIHTELFKHLLMTKNLVLWFTIKGLLRYKVTKFIILGVK